MRIITITPTAALSVMRLWGNLVGENEAVRGLQLPRK
jgi:hypothetical protein